MRIHSAIVMVLFLASAFAGALISYVPSVAWSRFALIAVGVVLYVAFSILPDQIEIGKSRQMPLLRYILAVLPTIVVIYFVLTNDWTMRLGKLNWLDPVLRALSQLNVMLPGLRLDSNAFGGALAMLIPLQIAALWRERVAERVIAVGLLLVSLLGLVVSASRGAWIAFGVVIWIAIIWILLERVIPGWQSSRERGKQIAIWGMLVVCLVLTIGIALTLTPLGTVLLEAGGGHWVVARNSLDLVSDYPFTGIGLGAFTMAYSSYILLVHVPHTIHAHNLFLDIWLEQGLLGLSAFMGLIVVGGLNAPGSRWRIAALASLGVMLIHGLLDDPFYGYGGNAIPLLFVPLGILMRESAMAKTRFPSWLAPVLAGALVAIVLLTALLPTTRAMFEANLGALAQTRAELSVYRWPEWGIQDDLRRSPQINLVPAIAHYQTALAADSANVTANRRLGQIELSRGEYDSARRHLETAYAGAPEQRATRQMLGESYAIAGEFEKATALWKTIDLNENQIVIRQWWYDHIGEHERATRLQAAITDGSQ